MELKNKMDNTKLADKIEIECQRRGIDFEEASLYIIIALLAEDPLPKTQEEVSLFIDKLSLENEKIWGDE